MNQTDENHIIAILTQAFHDNKSTNFVIKQDKKKTKRFRTLIKYSIFYGEYFGEVFLSNDKTACYITLDSTKKKTTLKSIFWDLRLIFQCVGLSNVSKVLKREALIKANHPKDGFMHLWYIGVLPSEQGKGKGSLMMKSIIEKSKMANKKVCLETSVEQNFGFYTSLGFKEENTIQQLGYALKMYALP